MQIPPLYRLLLLFSVRFSFSVQVRQSDSSPSAVFLVPPQQPPTHLSTYRRSPASRALNQLYTYTSERTARPPEAMAAAHLSTQRHPRLEPSGTDDGAYDDDDQVYDKRWVSFFGFLSSFVLAACVAPPIAMPSRVSFARPHFDFGSFEQEIRSGQLPSRPFSLSGLRSKVEMTG